MRELAMRPEVALPKETYSFTPKIKRWGENKEDGEAKKEGGIEGFIKRSDAWGRKITEERETSRRRQDYEVCRPKGLRGQSSKTALA